MTSKSLFKKIAAVFADLNMGHLFAAKKPMDVVNAPVYNISVYDEETGMETSLTELAGGRPEDPRFFFRFPDGSAGVLIEATGSYYRLTETEIDSKEADDSPATGSTIIALSSIIALVVAGVVGAMI